MQNKTKNKVKLGCLISLALILSTSTIYEVYSAVNQDATFKGNVVFTSYPHVDAKVEAYIDDSLVDTVIFENTESSTTKDSSLFNDAFTLTNSSDGTASGGYVLPDLSKEVKFKVYNTSDLDYKLSYSLTFTQSDLDNLTVSGVNSETQTMDAGDSVVTSTYSFTITDLTQNATGKFNWSLTLTGSK